MNVMRNLTSILLTAWLAASLSAAPERCYIIALKRGGADDPSNMLWQTLEDAKKKDRIE